MIEYVFLAGAFIIIWWVGLIMGYYLRCKDECVVPVENVVSDDERIKI